MNTLDEMALRHGTDKASTGHGYTTVYNSLFERRRSDVLKVLEIGVDKGASLRTWAEFFPRATIYGLDLNVSRVVNQERRIVLVQGDQSRREDLDCIPGELDFIVDDGSHKSEHQLKTLRFLWPKLKARGIYAIEDVYPWIFGARLEEQLDIMATELLHKNGDLARISIYPGLVILQKGPAFTR